jgi:hypothetical protein
MHAGHLFELILWRLFRIALLLGAVWWSGIPRPAYWFQQCLVAALLGVLVCETICDSELSSLGLDGDCYTWRASGTFLVVDVLALATRLSVCFRDPFWNHAASAAISVALGIQFIIHREGIGLVRVTAVAATLIGVHVAGLFMFPMGYAALEKATDETTASRHRKQSTLEFLVTVQLLILALAVHWVWIANIDSIVASATDRFAILWYTEFRDAILTVALVPAYMSAQ